MRIRAFSKTSVSVFGGRRTSGRWAGGPCPYGSHEKVCIFNVCDTISKSIFKKKTSTVDLCVNNQCVLELLAKRVSAFLADGEPVDDGQADPAPTVAMVKFVLFSE